MRLLLLTAFLRTTTKQTQSKIRAAAETVTVYDSRGHAIFSGAVARDAERYGDEAIEVEEI